MRSSGQNEPLLPDRSRTPGENTTIEVESGADAHVTGTNLDNNSMVIPIKRQ